MTTSDQAPKDLIGFFDFYLVKKAPFQLPKEVKEFLVKFGPWIALVWLLLSLPALLVMLGIGTAFMPFGGAVYSVGFTYVSVVLLAQLLLLALALPGLFKRKMSAWRLMFYSQLISIVSSLLMGSIFGAIIGGLIGLYILFQIRPLYS